MNKMDGTTSTPIILDILSPLPVDRSSASVVVSSTKTLKTPEIKTDLSETESITKDVLK